MTVMTITLDKVHKHGGKDYPIGSQLTVHEKLGEWLIAQRVGHATPSGTAPQRATPIHHASCCGRKT